MKTLHRPFSPADASRVSTFVADFTAVGAEAMVVVEDGLVIAYADLAETESGRFCRLGRLSVAPEARRRGIGRGLINAIAGKAFTYAPEFRAACSGADTAALLLLSSAGFSPVSVEPAGNGARIHFTRKRPEPCLSDFLNGLEDGEVVPFRR